MYGYVVPTSPHTVMTVHSCHFLYKDGWTALHFSSKEGNVDVAYVLIEANAHVNQQAKVTSQWMFLTQAVHAAIVHLWMTTVCSYICSTHFSYPLLHFSYFYPFSFVIFIILLSLSPLPFHHHRACTFLH